MIEPKTASERIRALREEAASKGPLAPVIPLFPSAVYDDDSTAGTPDHNRKV